MKRICVALAIVVGMAGAYGSAQTPPLIDAAHLAGTYHVEGQTEKGTYVGEATIMQRERAVFVQWVLDNGETYAGFGIVTGQSVAVGYATGQVGVAVVYAITADRLVGEWPDGEGVLHTETLTRSRPGDVPIRRVVPRVQARRERQ